MEKRLLYYIEYMKNFSAQADAMTAQEREEAAKKMLTQIQFFQHERLVHLIVTMTFAVMAMMSLLGGFLTEIPVMSIAVLAFLVLLVPYIRHYFILENGVQELYRYYDVLTEEKGTKKR